MFANITETSKGYPRLQYEDYTYGRRKLKKNEDPKYLDAAEMHWTCTRSDNNKKRCTARIITKVIDGYVMMKERNPTHICTK